MDKRFEDQDKQIQNLIEFMNIRFEDNSKKLNFITILLSILITMFFGTISFFQYQSMDYQKEILNFIKTNYKQEK